MQNDRRRILSPSSHPSRARLVAASSRALADQLEPRRLLAVVINEIHYDPDVKTEPVEFIELHNTGPGSVDLSGASFAEGVSFTIPNGTSVPAGGYLVVAENPAAVQAKFGRPAIGPWTGSLDNDGETVRLVNAAGVELDEVDYELGFPWPTVGDAPGKSIQLINPAFDRNLGGNWRSAAPTPRLQNSVFAANAPPQMRQVNHAPNQPSAGQAVTITTKVTDPQGVQSVSLKYQVVNPGTYIALEDAAYNNAANWTTLAMRDDGAGGDAVAGDDVFTAVVPANVQQHRRLIRYRVSSTDDSGASVTAPYADDPQPNFAYYVYNGMPAWTGAARPGVTPSQTYGNEVMDSLPVFQLITTRQSHERSQHIPDSNQGGYTGSDYLWSGTLVYDGKVYDHVHYRARGGVWRYAMGKNMWKFDFNRGHEFEARDPYGNPYPVKWSKLNLGSNIQQNQFGQRGEQGIFESVGFQLFNLAGVAGSRTAPVHFRIVEHASESGPSGGQYDDDFQGLYLSVEQGDGRFLDAHGLPDGNLYKMERGSGPGNGSLNNQGPTQPTGNADLVEFTNTYLNGSTTDQWWRDNFDLDGYYNYRAIVEAIRHYDIGDGKNYFYYHNPQTDKWSVLPWDLDLTWAPNMYGDGAEPFRDRVLSRSTFLKEYRNRMREIRDLLFNDEQVGQMIDEYARMVDTSGASFVEADRAMWDYNPILESDYVQTWQAGHGNYYRAVGQDDGAGNGFRAMAELTKQYASDRAAYIDDELITSEDDAKAPRRRTVSYTGPAGFAADRLSFRTNAFAAGSSGGSFAAMQWRIADVTPVAPGQPPRYEITPAWQSAELTTFNAEVTVPSTAVHVGHQYRVRVRMKDSNGRWSHWSDPLQFTAGTPADNGAVQSLRVTELHYNPRPAPGGTPDADEFEFIELQNIGAQPVALRNVQITGAIGFTFPDASLAPGAFVVVARNPAAFASRYGGGITVLGPYTNKLDNGGGQILLLDAVNQTVQDFTYDDAWHLATDGDGPSLVKLQPATAAPATWSQAAGWRASTSANPGGSPGAADPTGPAGATVVARHVFYNNSSFDGNNPEAGVLDDAAIATDKQALLPGGTATFANYTSYSKGLNGIIVDIRSLPEHVTQLAASDFAFQAGNTNTPATWAALTTPPIISIRRDVNPDGRDRVTLTWPDAQAVRKQWLRVTVNATGDTGLAAPDVFFFGNAVGESGNSATDAVVNGTDFAGARDNQRGSQNLAPVTWRWDYNRDGLVNGTDLAIARDNTTSTAAALQLFTPPLAVGTAAGSGSGPRTQTVSASTLAAAARPRRLGLRFVRGG